MGMAPPSSWWDGVGLDEGWHLHPPGGMGLALMGGWHLHPPGEMGLALMGGWHHCGMGLALMGDGTSTLLVGWGWP